MHDDSIAAPGLAHRAMAPELDLIADLMGGTAAMRRGDWQLAAAEALDSRWAGQTGHRAAEVAAMLRGDGDGN